MKLYIRQKVFSWADQFTVKDMNGIDRYFCQGEVFSWGHKLHLFNAYHDEVAFIRQKLLAWLPKYEVYTGGQLRVTVCKELSLIRQRYTLQGTDWAVSGDFWGHNYSIRNSGGEIASITKAWLSWGDSYELDIADGIDEVLAVATVLAIDSAIEQASKASN